MVREGTPTEINDPYHPRYGLCEGITLKGLKCRKTQAKGLSVCNIHYNQDSSVQANTPQPKQIKTDDPDAETDWRHPSWNPNAASKAELANILLDNNVRFHPSSSRAELQILFLQEVLEHEYAASAPPREVFVKATRAAPMVVTRGSTPARQTPPASHIPNEMDKRNAVITLLNPSTEELAEAMYYLDSWVEIIRILMKQKPFQKTARN